MGAAAMSKLSTLRLNSVVWVRGVLSITVPTIL